MGGIQPLTDFWDSDFVIVWRASSKTSDSSHGPGSSLSRNTFRHQLETAGFNVGYGDCNRKKAEPSVGLMDTELVPPAKVGDSG